MPVNIVIRTEPKAGKPVEPNSVVTIVVSQGPAPIVIPDVSGLSQVDATQQLAERGLPRGRDHRVVVAACRRARSSAPSRARAPRRPRTRRSRSWCRRDRSRRRCPTSSGQSQSSATSTLENDGLKVVGRHGHESGQCRARDQPEPHGREPGDGRVHRHDHRRGRGHHDVELVVVDDDHEHHRSLTRTPWPAPRRLAVWYAEHGRHDLPWRATRDRWAVLVSEVMLQQTQVARVLVAWPAFMARFPTPAAMAAAPARRRHRRVGPARLPAPGPPPLGGGAA